MLSEGSTLFREKIDYRGCLRAESREDAARILWVFKGMRRYLLTALAIGSAVTLVVLILYFAGVFTPMANWLGNVYVSRGFFGGEVLTRIKWLEIPVIAAGSQWVAWSVIDVSRPGQKITVALLIASVVFGLSPTLAFYGYLFDPFSSLAAVLLAAMEQSRRYL